MGFKTCAVVKVDGANGIGALKAAQLQKHLTSSLSLLIHNDGTSGVLNEGVSMYNNYDISCKVLL